MEKKTKGIFILRRFFPPLSEQDLLLLQEHSLVIRLKKSQPLFLSGDTPQALFYIEHGCLKVVRESEEGESIMTRLAAPGHIIGAREIFADLEYQNSTIALKESEILAIEKSAILELAHKNPAFLLSFVKSFCVELNQLEKRIAADLYSPAKNRIIEIIYDLYCQFGEPGKNFFVSPLNRRDIAELADVTPETVSRALSELKQEKALKTHGTTFTLLDLNAFQYKANES